MGRPPPSPCKVCGSANHWDKECPDWNVYLESRKRTAKLGFATEEDDSEKQYQYAYSVLLDDKIASQFEKDSSSSKQDFSEAVDRDEGACEVANVLKPRKTGMNKSARIVEIEDGERSGRRCATLPEESTYILEEVDIQKQAEPPPMDQAKTAYHTTSASRGAKASNSRTDEQEPKFRTEEEQHDPQEETATLPNHKVFAKRRIVLPKGKVTTPGKGSAGMSVLSIRGRVAHECNAEIDLRLDSCADITLISEEYFDRLKFRPKVRQGQKMTLWQLTDNDCVMRGYVHIPILVPVGAGKFLELEAEAYIVPRMTVPILLGEDFQILYEVGVQRSATESATISFRGTPFQVKASPVDKTNDFERLQRTAHTTSSDNDVKKRTHRTRRNQKQRAKQNVIDEWLPLTVSSTTRIGPDVCKRIPVENHLLKKGTYFFERDLIARKDDSCLICPNIIFDPASPFIPVANTSSHPQLLRKGEVLGYARLATGFFDEPTSEKEREVLKRKSSIYQAFIAAHHTERDPGTNKNTTSPETAYNQPEQKQNEEEEEDLGPKSANLPDLTVYPSAGMRDLLDVGDLPENLEERAWAMLKKHERAFGFDGRLGIYPGKVQIRTKEGQSPISLPMYGSSPAKRAIIDEQIDKWFEQGVIEPSKSPWGAPVVIAYRNGKPRFCVDYRRLNAVTTPDEFPLPRQSEILSSLAGAQVLSSLDALSGFTQLEMDTDHKEKTAFRSHRGLFQFKRMPFGLRNGPSIFQRIMQGILSPYLWIFCLVYIDDIVVYLTSYEAHIDHLDKVLTLIEASGITLSPVKCHFFYGSILLLGHKVSRLGLSTHLEKVRAVLELAKPTKLSELQTFLGMAVYFSTFIPHYADKCTPLFTLLRKGAKWAWTEDHEEAWISLKNALQEAPVLGHPMEGRPYRLYTDASDQALGCALQQVQPIKLKDMKGTKVYQWAEKAFAKGDPPPILVT